MIICIGLTFSTLVGNGLVISTDRDYSRWMSEPCNVPSQRLPVIAACPAIGAKAIDLTHTLSVNIPTWMEDVGLI
jgi:hypothetical protein